MPQTLWLFRHAHRWDFFQPEWFNTATYPYDPPLSPEGERQAICISQHLYQEPIHLIFTSPFLRTIQTAAPLSAALNLPIRLEWGLCEWLCRDWTPTLPTTTPIEQLLTHYPTIDRSYCSHFIPQYPETLADLHDRTYIITENLVQKSYVNSLIIAHKGSVLGIAATLTQNPEWRSTDLPCAGGLKLVRRDDRIWTVTEMF
jgi:broad specificity phosphatase PhoE